MSIRELTRISEWRSWKFKLKIIFSDVISGDPQSSYNTNACITGMIVEVLGVWGSQVYIINIPIFIWKKSIWSAHEFVIFWSSCLWNFSTFKKKKSFSFTQQEIFLRKIKSEKWQVAHRDVNNDMCGAQLQQA